MADSLSFSLEYLPNIRQLVLLIPIELSESGHSNTKLFLNLKSKKLYTGEYENQSDLLISVPGKISLEAVCLPIEGDELQNYPQTNRIDNFIILQFRNVDVKASFSIQELVTSKSLQNGCKYFSCSACSHILKEFTTGEFIFKDLPNEHWLELLDCWSCHDNEFAPIAERALAQKLPEGHACCHENHHIKSKNEGSATTKSYEELNNSSNGLILPPQGKIYLGTSHVLMNKLDFCASTCPQCHLEISESLQNNHVKIFRDAIRFDGARFLPESFITILMHKILDTIDNHSTFHFVLKATGKPKLYLRPVNWNMIIYNQESQHWIPAFKVGYAQLDHQAPSEAEVIICTSCQYDQIFNLLNCAHIKKLFGSIIKIPGSETLNLSYLIN